MKDYEIVMRIKIIYTGDDIPDDAFVISPIKNAIKRIVKTYRATHELTVMSDKVEALEEEESII